MLLFFRWLSSAAASPPRLIPPALVHLPRRYDVCCISDLKQRFFSPAPAFFARARHRRRQGTFADIRTDSRPTRLYSPWPSRLTRLFLSSDFTSGPFFFILSQRTFNFELCYFFFFHPFHFYLCERSLLYTHARTHSHEDATATRYRFCLRHNGYTTIYTRRRRFIAHRTVNRFPGGVKILDVHITSPNPQPIYRVNDAAASSCTEDTRQSSTYTILYNITLTRSSLGFGF